SLAEILRAKFDIPTIYLTAFADPATLERAKETEPYGYIVKPFRESELRAAIEMAIYRHRMTCEARENEAWRLALLRSVGDGIVGVDTDGRVKFMNAAAE